MFEEDEVAFEELNIEKACHPSYVWSKKVQNGRRKGMLEIYRVMECDGFTCYPMQIPIVTFHSPDHSIADYECQHIIQCLVKQAEESLGEEMSFTLMSWIDDNIKVFLSHSDCALFLWTDDTLRYCMRCVCYSRYSGIHRHIHHRICIAETQSKMQRRRALTLYRHSGRMRRRKGSEM